MYESTLYFYNDESIFECEIQWSFKGLIFSDWKHINIFLIWSLHCYLVLLNSFQSTPRTGLVKSKSEDTSNFESGNFIRLLSYCNTLLLQWWTHFWVWYSVIIQRLNLFWALSLNEIILNYRRLRLNLVIHPLFSGPGRSNGSVSWSFKALKNVNPNFWDISNKRKKSVSTLTLSFTGN